MIYRCEECHRLFERDGSPPTPLVGEVVGHTVGSTDVVVGQVATLLCPLCIRAAHGRGAVEPGVGAP